MGEQIHLYNSTICRLCAEDNGNGESLFSKDGEKPDLGAMINRYLPLKVHDDGKLPQTICPGCNIQLEATIQFFDLVADGQKKIQELWKQQVEFDKKAKCDNELSRQNDLESLAVLEGTEIVKNSEDLGNSENFDSYNLEKANEDREGGVFDQELYVNMITNSAMYTPDHEMKLKMEGPHKFSRKRGRSLKIDDKNEGVEKVQDGTNQDDEYEEVDDETGRGRRRRKIPKRFMEAVRGKELDRLFKDEKILDEGDFEHQEYLEDSEDVKFSQKPDSNEIIGHVETEEGEEVGEFVILNRNRGRGRPKKKKSRYYCYVCGKGFNQLNRYLTHKALHKNIKFKCLKCDKEFSNEDNLHLHQKTNSHSGHEIVKIKDQLSKSSDVTPITDNVSSNLQNSAGENSTDNTSSVNIENQNSDCRITVEDQTQDPLGIEGNIVENLSEENPKTLICDQCTESFSSREEREMHLKNKCHTSEKQKKDEKTEKGFPCDICGKVLNHPSSILYHKEAEHNNGRRFVCNKCGKSFKHKQLLQRHQLVHSEERPHVCKTCNASFKTKANLINHQSTHTGEKKFSCSLCSQQFAHKTSLTLHQRWHTGHKPFKCQVCSKSFSQNGNLQEHMRIHTGEKPYCCHHCGRKFTTSSQFKLHVKRHTGERPWKCEYCEKSFLHKDTWKCHVRRHNGERPFLCPYCSRAFTEQWALKKHVRLHTGEKPYSCDVCGKAFADCSNLTKHKKVHKENKMNETTKVPEEAVSQVWRILPSEEEITEVIADDQIDDDDDSQYIYVSIQDADIMEQSRMLQIVDPEIVELNGELTTVDGQTLRAIRIEDDELVAEEAMIKTQDCVEKVDDNISASVLQVQITDDEGKLIPLTMEDACQLVSEGQIISQRSDGQIVKVNSGVGPQDIFNQIAVNSKQGQSNNRTKILSRSRKSSMLSRNIEKNQR